jgi:hypothetical protein
MTVKLLHAVANDSAGGVIHVTDDRATRLIRTGYAVPVDPPKKAKER